jgi:hypothetical protein
MIIYYEPGNVIKIELVENKDISPCDLPYGLTDLYLGKFYNKPIKKNILPSSLKKIVFGDKYNQELYIDIFPLGLKFLQFGREFNKQININVLPENLTHLIFTGTYNYLITHNTIPKKLLYLVFNYNKYEINEYILPDTLTHLKLGYNYNFEFKKNVLPKNLFYLELGGIYSYILVNVPETLNTLYICGSIENKLVIDNLPNIENLIFYNLQIELTNLPITIKKIKLICYTINTYKFLQKIPFGCKIVDKNDKEIK